jgi:hypothetical protein
MLDIVIVTPEKITKWDGQGQLCIKQTTKKVTSTGTDYKFEIVIHTPDTGPAMAILEDTLEICAASVRWIAQSIKSAEWSNTSKEGGRSFIFIDMSKMDYG